MNPQDNATKVADLDQLLDFRDKTERISAFLTKRLKDHLSTLSPVLAPKLVFGKYIGARDSAPHADEAFGQLTRKYNEVSGSPFNLRGDLPENALSSSDGGIEIYPWEYTHEAHGLKTTKNISMTSPVRWVATYVSEYSPAQMQKLLLTPGERRPDSVRNFIVNSIAFQLVLSRKALLMQLLKDLRYDVTVQPLPGLGKLPMVVFDVQLASFRPADDLLLTAVRLSGVPAFIELIDTGAVSNLEDPLRQQIEARIQQAV
jgi:hypothetical protein